MFANDVDTETDRQNPYTEQNSIKPMIVIYMGQVFLLFGRVFLLNRLNTLHGGTAIMIGINTA